MVTALACSSLIIVTDGRGLTTDQQAEKMLQAN